MKRRRVLDEIGSLLTERKEYDLSSLSPDEIFTLSVEENVLALLKVREVRREVIRLAEWWAEALSGGGRVLLVGAGTSGRLAVMEAAEMYPTFGIPRDRVVGVIAGGKGSVFASKEGAEDVEAEGKRAVSRIGVGRGDLVVGLSASGRTPYVRGALERARERGSRTALITTNPCEAVSIEADMRVCVPVGAEILPGSTRMKSATVQKVVLNTVSLIGAVLMGKVERGRMVDMVPTSEKLKARAILTLVEEFGVGEREAEALLESVGWSLKEAFRILTNRRQPRP